VFAGNIEKNNRRSRS